MEPPTPSVIGTDEESCREDGMAGHAAVDVTAVIKLPQLELYH